jgi:hypothetical protein
MITLVLGFRVSKALTVASVCLRSCIVIGCFRKFSQFVTTRLIAGAGDEGSSERVFLRHHDPHLALEHFRLGAAHFGTSFLSSRGLQNRPRRDY